jgi:hypothetical protein
MKKDICMNKLTYKNYFSSSLLAVALCFSAYSVSAATTTSNTDDGSAIGTSDTPQLKQQNKTTDTPTHNKTISKKSRMHKKNAVTKDMQTGTDTNSMNNKPIGTTTGESNNGSVDETKEGPVNGTHTGTN